MKLVITLLVFIIAFAIAAGIIVVRHNGTKACVSYYNKDGSHTIYKDCE